MIYSTSTSWKKKKKLVEEQQSARRSPRPESGLRSLAKSYDFTSLGSPPRVVDLSSYSPSPLPSASFPAARAFVMEALHHGAKAELMTDVEERPWKRPRFQQWLRGPRRIPGRVRPGGSASDNKGFISLSGGSGSRAGRGVDVSHARFKPPPPPLAKTQFLLSLAASSSSIFERGASFGAAVSNFSFFSLLSEEYSRRSAC